VVIVDPTLQTFSIKCQFTKPSNVTCEQAFYIGKSKFEIILSPKDASTYKITDLVMSSKSKPKPRGNLTRFPKELIVELPKLNRMEIIAYTFDSVVFDDSIAKLEELLLLENKIKTFKSTLTGENSKISYLKLFANGITEIEADFFKGMNGLRRISLDRNQITKINPDAFKHLKMLYRINLSNNPLKTIQVEMFQSIPPNLNELILIKISISEFPNGAFKNFLNLTVIDLFQNNLKSFIARDLELKNCEKLYLGNNKIEKINLNGVAGLRKLLLGSNRLNTFNVTENGLTSCKKIELFKNNISEFTLNNVTNLEEINLESNKLKSISAEMFSEDAMLKKVSFRKNRITSIDKKFMDLLTKPNLTDFIINPCAKEEVISQKKVVNLKRCFKNFEKDDNG
jgi:Leucine-rich repeat (LRR) protein